MLEAKGPRWVAAIAVALIAACGGGRDADLDTTVAGGNVAVDSPAATTPPPPDRELPTTDGGAVDVLATIDAGEVEEAELARTKAQNAQVKAFARMMIDEHSKDLRTLGDVVKNAAITGATKVGVKVDSVAPGTTTPTGIIATLQSMHQQTMSTLNGLTGAAFDRAYIDAQVTAHQEGLNIVQQLQTRATAPQLQQHFSQVASAVQRHLDRARELQTQLGTAPTDTAPTSNYRPKQ
ncbi:MAG TPA: DUF4142 domain-containing protein [Gemmatimonadaceae bacterium]|nr:DUF4142 domain-containing protein [Gemmatimonadaceae bacterium]